MRQLRKAASEVESENNQILSHMRALNAMIGRNEQDAVRLMAHNEALTDQLEMIKRSAIERVKATSSYAQNGNSSEVFKCLMLKLEATR